MHVYSKMTMEIKEKDTKINIKMEELRKELYKKFPSHHHAHIQIFSTFWGLFNLVVKEGGLTNE